jgi:hypothetical protein
VALRGALAASVDGLETDVCRQRALLPHEPYLPVGTDLEGFAQERTRASSGGRGFETARTA